VRNSLEFTGIRYISLDTLGISQMYLNQKKLDEIHTWFSPQDLSNFSALPVLDFGNGRLTLTDGHSRAYVAYKAGVKEIPVEYDRDDMIISETGQKLYRNDIIWCNRFNLKCIADLNDRIVPNEVYQRVWLDRCKAGYHLLIHASEADRARWEKQYPHLFIYGVDKLQHTLYFEDELGKTYTFSAK